MKRKYKGRLRKVNISIIYRKIAEKSRYQIQNFFRYLKNTGEKILVKVTRGLRKSARAIKSAFKKIASKIKHWIKKCFWAIHSPSIKALAQIKRRINRTIKPVAEKAGAQITLWLDKCVQAIKAVAIKLFTGMKRWLSTAIQPIKTASARIIEKIKLRYTALEESAKNWDAKRIDILLAGSLTVLFIGFLIMNLTFEKPYQPKWTELQVSGQWETVFDSDTLNGLIAEFEELNPQLRIKHAVAGKAAGQDAPDTLIADNGNSNLPDIVFMDDSLLSNFIRQEALMPLNSFTSNSDAAGQWAIPLVLSMDMLFYNVDALQSAGFDRPPKTRDEFLRYAHTVSESSSGTYGTAPGLSKEDSHAIRREVFSWLWAGGFSVIKDNEPALDRKTLTDLIAFLEQLNQAGPPRENVFDKTGAQRLQEFAQGRLAMIIAPTQAISVLREQQIDFDFGITVIPEPAVPGKNSLGLSGLYAGISGTCGHPDEAWQFLSFLEEKSLALAAQVKAVPGHLQGLLPSAKGTPGDYLNEDPLYAKAWDIFESSDIDESFSGYPLAAELEKIIREELRACFDKLKSPAESAAAILSRWQEIAEY